MARGPCRNRRVVHVDHRLHSPFYDWEGASGLAQSSFEFSDADAMCYWGLCGPQDVNAWFQATDNYFSIELIPQYNRIESRATAMYEGAALPLELSDRLGKVKKLINEWLQFKGVFVERSFSEGFLHPTHAYWIGEVKKIIVFFDAAACEMEALNNIAEIELKSPGLVEHVPAAQAEKPPVGDRWLGGAGGVKRKTEEGDMLTTALILGGIGFGGYFLFKVLTE